MYQDEEGKNIDYQDRISDQEEIKQFTDKIFNSRAGGCNPKSMTFKQYELINKTISSEMFYSLMAVLHEKLPCATGYFRMRKQFKDNQNENSSPIRTIASPKMIRGLSIPKANRNQRTASECGQSPKGFSPDIRIKNLRQTELAKKQGIS